MSRTSCGLEVEEAIVKELLLQGFPEKITREVITTYNIDSIIFENIMKDASIKIDELHQAWREESISWSELAELTHKTQVMRFGWCSCEDNEGNENPYSDCPAPRVRVLREVEL
jgi:hypothetical protein